MQRRKPKKPTKTNQRKIPAGSPPPPLPPLLAQPQPKRDLAADRVELLRCEATISRGASAFVDMILAFEAIAAKGLYEANEYQGFGDYCTRRWGISRGHGYRFRDAARIVREIQHLNQSGTRRLPLPGSLAAYQELDALLPKNTGSPGVEPAEPSRAEKLAELLTTAQEVASKKLEMELSGEATPTNVVIEAEHIRSAAKRDQPPMPPKPRDRLQSLMRARRNVEALVLDFRRSLDNGVAGDKVLLAAAEELLKQLAAVCESP